jgi:hypothetical protein
MDKTGVTDWFKGLFSKSTKVKVDSPSYGEVVDDVAENVDGSKVTDQAAKEVGHLTPWSQMSKAEAKAFQHSYSRHASELGLPNWSQSRAAELQVLFNNAVSNIRNAGCNGFFRSQELVNGVRTTVNRTEPIINGQRYFYYESLQGKFISAGKMP